MTIKDKITGRGFYGSNTIISAFADTNGDGTGTKNAIGNYSGAQEIFYVQPPVGTVYRVHRMLISLEDTAGMQAQEYGNLGAALTNGVQIRVQGDTGTLTDLTDGVPVKTNAHWGRMCYDVDVKSWGSGNELLCVRWTFAKSGAAIVLDGSRHERIEILLDDSFAGLLSQYFLIQGNIA
jgi:hypothetical protein